MLRKPLLLIMSAALLLWFNLNVCYTVSVGGQELPGLYSARQLDRCAAVSAAAVAELSAGSSASAGYEKRICVGLQDADGDPRILNDALITSAPGTVRRCEVYVYGVYTDVVSDPEQVINALPDGVETGVSLRPVYGEAPVHPA